MLNHADGSGHEQTFTSCKLYLFEMNVSGRFPEELAGQTQLITARDDYLLLCEIC